MQDSIVDFVRYIDPNPEDVETWKPYSNDAKKVMNFGDPNNAFNYATSFGDDPLDGAKCDYWQDAPYFPTDSKKSPQLVQQSGSYKEYL